MHQIVCRLRLRPCPTGGAYSAPPDPVAVFKGPTSKGRKGEGRWGRGLKGRGEGMVGREFVLCPRKKKEKSAPMPVTVRQNELPAI